MAIKKKMAEKKTATTMQKKEDMKKGSPAKMSYGTSPAKQAGKSSAKAAPVKMKKC